MKRILIFALTAALLLSVTACGGAEAPQEAAVDLSSLYTSYQQTLPEMMVLDEGTMLSFLGIQAEDCVQVITAVCANGLQADEVWLIQAKDSQALERLTTLAQTRQAAKEDETVSYLPDQYTIVTESKLLTEGLYLAYLVSPDVDTLAAAFDAAVK